MLEIHYADKNVYFAYENAKDEPTHLTRLEPELASRFPWRFLLSAAWLKIQNKIAESVKP